MPPMRSSRVTPINTHMLVVVAYLLLAFLVLGCTQVKNTVIDVAKAETAIEAEFGIDVDMEWNISNGDLTSVGVVFSSLPADAPNLREFMQRVVDLVNENMEQKPGYINIQYIAAGN